MITEMEKQQIIQNFNVEPSYADIVFDAYKDEKRFFIPNRTIEHARLLAYLLFDKAKSSIKIFSGSMNRLLYENQYIRDLLVSKLQKNPGLTISIITEKEIDSQTLKDDLERVHSDNIKFHRLTRKRRMNHFILIDDKAFRIEAFHADGNHEFIGKANFNEPVLANQLNNIFNEFLKISSNPD